MIWACLLVCGGEGRGGGEGRRGKEKGGEDSRGMSLWMTSDITMNACFQHGEKIE